MYPHPILLEILAFHATRQTRRSESRLEAYSTGRHSGSGRDDFSIRTSWGSGEWAARKVSDYLWNTQPK
jgi:hypothetical protein